MSYESFMQRVNALAARVGNIKVDFCHDREKGKYVAGCSDGTTIIGFPHSMKVTVRWGSSHMAMAEI